MCQIGFNHFACGCATPIESTLKQCDYIRMSTQRPDARCPDYQLVERPSRSKSYMMACMGHSG